MPFPDIWNVIESGSPSISITGFGILHTLTCLSAFTRTVNSVSFFFHLGMFVMRVVGIYVNTYQQDILCDHIISYMVGLPSEVRCRAEDPICRDSTFVGLNSDMRRSPKCTRAIRPPAINADPNGGSPGFNRLAASH